MPTLAPAAVGDYSGTMVRGDFNGDGKMDVAASSPEHDCGKGRVYVRLDGGSTTLWHRDTFGILGVAACNDNFGTSLAAADLNGDGRDDLIVGVPGANDPGQTNAGAMQVIYGSASGLTTTGDQLWHQNTTGIEGVSEVNDYLGDTLTVGDFNCDTYSDVVIGVPREAIGSNAEAGAVHVLYGSSGGLTSVNDIYYQGSGGVNGIAQAYDHFGAALAAGNIKGNQSSGVGCDDLTIGVPQEDIGTVTDAGYIYIAYGSASGLSTTGDQAFHQNVSGIVDTAQANDRFGERLEIVDVDRDGYGDIRVTVPGDGCVGPTGWGRHTLFGSATGIVTAGNAMDCDTFRCGVHDDDLSCTGGHPPVYGSTSDNRIAFLYGNDVAYGGSGNDELYGSHGGDVFIGGPGNDTLDGGPDIDILIGGSGNDAFIIDMDCEVEPGDIVDGGGGTDTVYSHRSQGELTTMGVTFVSIEQSW